MPCLAILIWLVAINAVAIHAFRGDKLRAIAGTRRIRERDLLALAWLGGSPGALFARRHYRHKTRKQPFSTWLMLVPMVQAGALIGLLWPR